jgi:hypothetical protein
MQTISHSHPRDWIIVAELGDATLTKSKFIELRGQLTPDSANSRSFSTKEPTILRHLTVGRSFREFSATIEIFGAHETPRSLIVDEYQFSLGGQNNSVTRIALNTAPGAVTGTFKFPEDQWNSIEIERRNGQVAITVNQCPILSPQIPWPEKSLCAPIL